MRILLDTNILILRENNHIIPENLAELMQLFAGLSCSLHVHALSIHEIKKDGNKERREVNLSKLNAYDVINEYPVFSDDEDFIQLVGVSKTSNDDIDNNLIYCVKRHVIDYFITEDNGILNKAEALGLNNIVNINEALTLFKKFKPDTNINMLPIFIKDKGFNFDLNDGIFNTLKKEYPEFPDWWDKRVSNRDVYAYKDENETINALLVPKIETNEPIDCSPTLIRNRILKICLFKVAEHTRGLKLGERLLRMGIDYAIQNKVEEIFLTHFRIENDPLVYLLEEFGFYKYGVNSRGEEVFLKQITKNNEMHIDIKQVEKINKTYYPSFYTGELVKKHFVPIIPAFHKKLFPDYIAASSTQQLSLFSVLDHKNSEGNSIKKAYICNAQTKKLKPGDILLFYRSHEGMCVTSVGTVEKVYYDQTNPDEIMKLIAKRTVFSIEDIKKLCDSPVLVILFNHNFHLINDVTLRKLREDGIISPSGRIQSITEISHENYMKIIEGNIDDRFIIY